MLKMDADNQASIGLDELSGYGSKAGTTSGAAIALNRVFIVGKLPLKASGRKNGIVIKKLERFKVDEYGKAEHRAMGSNHVETLKKHLEEVKAGLK